MRSDNRAANEIRPISTLPWYLKGVPGSTLYTQGQTRLVCSASLEKRVPHFLKNSGSGWITAEYSMLPASCGSQRVERERNKSNGRHQEIQRLVGRVMRTAVNPRQIGEQTITIDTDVIQADGSTRCAAVNGGFLALTLALKYLVYENLLRDLPEINWIAALSIGIKDDAFMLDLDYCEDSSCEADITVVSTIKGEIVEVQTCSEGRPIKPVLFGQALEVALKQNQDTAALLKKNFEEAFIATQE